MAVNFKYLPLHSSLGRGALYLGLQLLETGEAAEVRRRSLSESPMELLLVTQEENPLTEDLLTQVGVSIGEVIDFCRRHANAVLEAFAPNDRRRGSRLVGVEVNSSEAGVHTITLKFGVSREEAAPRALEQRFVRGATNVMSH